MNPLARAVTEAGLLAEAGAGAGAEAALHEFESHMPDSLLQHKQPEDFLKHFGDTIETFGMRWHALPKYSSARLACLFVFFQRARSLWPVSFDAFEGAVRLAVAKSRADAQLFHSCDSDEQAALLRFANWCTLVLRYVPAKGNKQLYMSLVPMLAEGPLAKYVTGGGATPPTKRRMLLFDKLSGVAPAKRDKRPSNDEYFPKSTFQRGKARNRSANSSKSRRKPVTVPKPKRVKLSREDIPSDNATCEEERVECVPDTHSGFIECDSQGPFGACLREEEFDEDDFYHYQPSNLITGNKSLYGGLQNNFGQHFHEEHGSDVPPTDYESSEADMPPMPKPFLRQNSDQWVYSPGLEFNHDIIFDYPSGVSGDLDDLADELLRDL